MRAEVVALILLVTLPVVGGLAWSRLRCRCPLRPPRRRRRWRRARPTTVLLGPRAFAHRPYGSARTVRDPSIPVASFA
jgi:hypothetical protein